MRRGIAAAVLCASLAGAAPAAAQGFGAGEFLRIPLGARTAAMGGASTGFGGDAFAVSLNPASAAFLRRPEVALERFDLFEDLSFHDGAYMTPLWDRSTLGVSFRALDYGDFLTTVEGDLSGIGTFNASDVAASITYAHRLDRWSLGAALQVARSELAGFTADAVALDLGAYYRTPWGLSFGLAGLHLGSGFTYVAVEEELPAEFRAGVGVHREVLGGIGLVSAALDLGVARGQAEGYAGGEIELYDRLALRIGWDGSIDAGTGIVGGVGIHWEGLALDYAFVPYGDLGGTHRFSGLYRFGSTRSILPEAPAPEAERPPEPLRRTEAPAARTPEPRVVVREVPVPAEEEPPFSPPPAAPARPGVFLDHPGDVPIQREAWAAAFMALVAAGDLEPAPADRAAIRVTLFEVSGGVGAKIRDARGALLDFHADTSGDPARFAQGLLDRIREVLRGR